MCKFVQVRHENGRCLHKGHTCARRKNYKQTRVRAPTPELTKLDFYVALRGCDVPDAVFRHAKYRCATWRLQRHGVMAMPRRKPCWERRASDFAAAWLVIAARILSGAEMVAAHALKLQRTLYSIKPKAASATGRSAPGRAFVDLKLC